jgi:molybdate transport system permease protein
MDTTNSLIASTDWSPLVLSLKVAAVATVLALIAGVALGWVFARKRFFGHTVLEAVFMLPLVLPPTVIGYAILVAAGRRSPLGAWLREHLDYTIIFSWHGAVVASAVVALPLVLKSAIYDAVQAGHDDLALLLVIVTSVLSIVVLVLSNRFFSLR